MPKTIRVRIAVAVSRNGSFIASASEKTAQNMASYYRSNDGDGHVVFVEADVPLPAGPQTVEGVVTP